MANSVNKPKVFLSHSSIDKPFINQLNDDLKKFKIDTWLDIVDIRDGRSWMKSIFQDGIAACDAVIVYLTENSIGSKMVKRELDTALLHQLNDGGVAVLPYVSDASIRSQLRPDLQTLQCRVWNEQNYQEILPSIVGEIWYSYLEKAVNAAVLQERNRNLGNQQQSEEEPPEDDQDAAITKISEWLKNRDILMSGEKGVWISYKDIAADTNLKIAVIKECVEYAAFLQHLKVGMTHPGSVYIIPSFGT